MVSHDLRETASISDILYLFADGEVIGHGEPDAMLTSTDERVKQFMQGLPDGPVPFHFPANNFEDDLLRVADEK